MKLKCTFSARLFWTQLLFCVGVVVTCSTILIYDTTHHVVVNCPITNIESYACPGKNETKLTCDIRALAYLEEYGNITLEFASRFPRDINITVFDLPLVECIYPRADICSMRVKESTDDREKTMFLYAFIVLSGIGLVASIGCIIWDIGLYVRGKDSSLFE